MSIERAALWPHMYKHARFYSDYFSFSFPSSCPSSSSVENTKCVNETNTQTMIDVLQLSHTINSIPCAMTRILRADEFFKEF